MKFTKEDMKTLSQWEGNMHTAIQSRYLRNVGRSAVRTIADIWARRLGVAQVAVNDSCSACVLDLLQRVGRAYFEQVEAEQTIPPREAVKRNKRGRKAKNDETK